ncbi:MAG: HD domain-containing protein [Bacteroidales bacterium]|nr:HD domain-containing protein [Bacteroidales bacterium]
MRNKLKIINDPVYGFINIPSELIFDIIQHPYFQRLKRLKQLGLSYYVYPGATHTRFEHVLGVMHLISIALRELEKKGQNISEEEKEAVLIAGLMHDIGHGPFSHTLEGSFIKGVNHEKLTLLFMEEINKQLKNKLSLGIKVFKNEYKKKFLHSLIASQLDMDRLDYLKRDSFYSGVTEGVIGSDRIIKMLKVVNDELAVEEKGIYSVEQFIVARRIMYWQVYLHKTVIAAEEMLKRAIIKAKQEYYKKGVFTTPALEYFFKTDFSNINNDSGKMSATLNNFAMLDDSDIIVSLKGWINHTDTTLSILSKGVINRDLFEIEISYKKFGSDKIKRIKEKIKSKYNVKDEDTDFLVFTDIIKNKAYSTENDVQINILLNSGEISDIAKASDLSNINALSKTVEKYYLCYPKDLI